MLKIFNIIRYSFYSAEFYKEIFYKLIGWKLQYLLYILAISLLPFIVVYYALLSDILHSELINQVISRFPEIQIVENNMVTKFDTPYLMTFDDKNIAAFTSKDDQINLLRNQKYKIIFGSSSISIFLLDDYSIFPYDKVLGTPNLVLNKELAIKAVDFIKSNLIWLISFMIYPMLIITQFLQLLLEVLLFSFIIYVFNKNFLESASFKDFVRLIVFAFYPAILLNSAGIIIPANLLWYLIIALKVYYSFFAIKSVKEQSSFKSIS